MAEDVPPEFYNLADKFIHLANSLTEEHGVARVSAVFLFAASRYNAHCMLAGDPDVEQNRQAAVAYFVEQYQKMLEDNIDWLKASQAGAPEG
ncbi:MAG TPA: DUF3144 domain-containing protein [Gemmataceae bacterium]|nr:DUF3144 domain-containing protein [Gemmataceae bacterium]